MKHASTDTQDTKFQAGHFTALPKSWEHYRHSKPSSMASRFFAYVKTKSCGKATKAANAEFRNNSVHTRDEDYWLTMKGA
jgi:hypothetical protein